MARNRELQAHSREFKLAAVARLELGESPTALSRELGVARKLLYDWRRRVAERGEQNLRGRGRPSAAEGTVIESAEKAERKRIGGCKRCSPIEAEAARRTWMSIW